MGEDKFSGDDEADVDGVVVVVTSRDEVGAVEAVPDVSNVLLFPYETSVDDEIVEYAPGVIGRESNESSLL